MATELGASAQCVEAVRVGLPRCHLYLFPKGTFLKNLCISCQMVGLGYFSGSYRTRGFPD